MNKITILLLLSVFFGFSQNKNISGTILDENKLPLIGANITIDGTSLGSSSETDGTFKLKGVAVNQKLTVSYIGYEIYMLVIDSRDNYLIQLTKSSNVLQDVVVVVGYGQTKSKDLTGAVSSVKMSSINTQPVTNVGDAIQGRAAGVQVITSGQPGSNPTIRIRGTGTIGSNDPLLVVDGMPLNGGLNQINMNDIESFQVLKDASSTAIYGARGANGVIIITTKRGTKDKSSLTFDTFTGITEATNIVEVLDASQFATMHNEMLTNAGLSTNPDFSNPSLLGKGTDWVSAFFDKGIQNSYTLSYSAGNEKSKSYTSLNILDQKGIIINTSYKRYILQFNNDSKISDNLKFGNNLKLNNDIKSQGEYNIQNALAALPTQPIFREDGNYSGPIGQPLYSGTIENPIGKAKVIENTTKGYNFQGTIFGELTFLKNFKFKTLAGGEGNFWKTRTWAPSYRWDSNISPNAYLSESSNQSITLLWDNTLTYQKKFENGINLTLLAGTSAQENKF